jgi:formate C-acetyltransferase
MKVKRPDLFTEGEWADIRASHFIHEQGRASNISPDYATTVARGLEARRSQSGDRLKRAEAEGDGEGILFLGSLIAEIDAVVSLAERHRLEAEGLGRTDLAAVLSQVPQYGARTFAEALQFFRILHFALWCEGEYHNTIGRFDRCMWPYFEADLREGRLTEEEPFDLDPKINLRVGRGTKTEVYRLGAHRASRVQ